ncbi:MAG: hypothetical protein AAGF94_18655 [Pseudomonadota bacterium]
MHAVTHTHPMQNFQTYDDVRDWLAPLGYEAFWSAIAPYGLFGDGDRVHCDRTLAEGIADMPTVLNVIKGMAVWRMVETYDLALTRWPAPHLSVVY